MNNRAQQAITIGSGQVERTTVGRGGRGSEFTGKCTSVACRPAARRSGWRVAFSVALRLALAGIALGFLVTTVVRGWSDVRLAVTSMRWSWAVAGVAAILAAQLLAAWTWHWLSAAFGAGTRLRHSIKAFALSQLAKYVPGKLWSVAVRVRVTQEHGGTAAGAGAAVLFESAMLMVSAAATGLLAWSTQSFDVRLRIALVGAAAPGIVLVLYPRGISFLLRTMGRLVRRDVRVQCPSRTDVVLAFGLYCAVWICFGTGIHCVVRSLAAAPLSNLPGFVAVYSTAWLAGFVVVFLPGGLGVREGVLASLLAAYVPLPIAAVVALMSRIIVSSLELALAGVVAWRR